MGRPYDPPLDVWNRGRGRGQGQFSYAGPGPGGTDEVEPAPPPPTLSLPPWTQVRPPEASDFTAFGRLAGLALGASTPIPGSEFTVPANNVGVIRSLTFDVNNLTPSDELVFRLRFDRNPVEGWEIEIFPRNAATITVSFGPDETYPVTPAGAIVDVTGQITAGGPLDVGASFHGWFVGGDTARRFRDAYRDL